MDTFTQDDHDTAVAASARRVDLLLAHYGESHRNPSNEAIHLVAIPLILLSLVGLMSAVHPWLAHAFIAASLVYYARLSFVFLTAMIAVSVTSLLLVSAMGDRVLPISAAVFLAAWIGQFIGHKLEGRTPSFFEDVQYLWVGPLFVLSRLFQRLGIRW